MRLTLPKALLATVCYADIFNFPLTAAEIHRFLVFKKSPPEKINQLLKRLSSPCHNDGWFFLHGRKQAVGYRQNRAAESRKKWEIAFPAVRVISGLPSVRLVGITGGLAMGNAAGDDDIDLLIITAKDTLWITRAILNILGSFLFDRRTPGDTFYRNKICLNMFMSEDELGLPADERDIFGAHELLQMRPVFSRGDTYVRLVMQNAWAVGYMPNAWIQAVAKKSAISSPDRNYQIINFLRPVYYALNQLLFILQKQHMTPKLSSEVVTKTYVRFHPQDARPRVMQAWLRRLRRLQIPLDKNRIGVAK
jgi:hypothetical protein